MKRINRQTMRGEKLSVACSNAQRSSREYGIGDYEFTGCYGINDAECATCGAWVYNAFAERANEVLREREKGGEAMSEPAYVQLRRGLKPLSRPTDEIVRYAKTLENIIGIYTNGIDFKLLHESAAPHWVDLLEGRGE